MLMFIAQIVNIPLVLSLSPVNESAATEPGGLWPGQVLCGWLSDGQNAQKRSAALLWLNPAVSGPPASPPGLNLWLKGETFLSTKRGWIRVFWGLKNYLQCEWLRIKHWTVATAIQMSLSLLSSLVVRIIQKTG